MKSVIAIIALCASVAASAQSNPFELKPGVAPSNGAELTSSDIRVEAIRGGTAQIALASPKCKPNEMCAPNAIVHLAFPLGGCLDTLGPVSYSIKVVNGSKVVSVSAVRIVSKKSQNARCFVQPIGRARINAGIVISADQVSVEFLEEAALK
ncbi:MAG: hypothetical protein V4736_05125 [Bdellovibrionota bacterium]